MSTHAIDRDLFVPEPSSKPRHTGLFGIFRAIASAIGEGVQAHDDYRHLTRNGTSHEDAVRHVLTRSYRGR